LLSLFSSIPFSHVYARFFYFLLGLFQREIFAAADTATRLYRENTPKALRSAPEIWEAMTKAQDRLIKTMQSWNFEK
jgi:long-subunit acyl-CoA synthetase (AMP-forming)